MNQHSMENHQRSIGSYSIENLLQHEEKVMEETAKAWEEQFPTSRATYDRLRSEGKLSKGFAIEKAEDKKRHRTHIFRYVLGAGLTTGILISAINYSMRQQPVQKNTVNQYDEINQRIMYRQMFNASGFTD